MKLLCLAPEEPAPVARRAFARGARALRAPRVRPGAHGVHLLTAWSGALSPNGGAIGAAVIEILTLALKTLFFCWLFVWVRWTTPRFRYDQLMGLGWKILLPIGIANLFVTALLVKAGVL